jgi:hypothetical protein
MNTKAQNNKQKVNINKSNVSTALVGQFFHSIQNGKLEWQGNVIGNPEAGWYLVQLFEWLMGEPNVQRLVRFEDMTEWFFYDDAEQMIYSYEYGAAKHHISRTKALELKKQ